jgi:hypothetical protein
MQDVKEKSYLPALHVLIDLRCGDDPITVQFDVRIRHKIHLTRLNANPMLKILRHDSPSQSTLLDILHLLQHDFVELLPSIQVNMMSRLIDDDNFSLATIPLLLLGRRISE